MKKTIALLLLSSVVLVAAGRRAKNVILFIGDAGGIPVLNAASIYGYKEPQKLFIQHMPHLGLMDTSAADEWVTDSAAAMTAIVTGQKTNNGVLSESAAAPGGNGRQPLKTILEYAEEHGLSTGVISNVSMADATPAACYAHMESRSMTGEIFTQVLKPRFGDGVDLVIGNGRKEIFDATAKLGVKLEPALRARGYAVCDAPEQIPADASRVVALFDSPEFDMGAVVRRATGILSRNRKGFFLMVEVDMHTDHVKTGLDHALLMDRVLRETAERAKEDTLILFSADHSFDLRLRGGRRSEPLLVAGGNGHNSNVRMDDGHTGEEVLVAAKGPGSANVHGFFANTDMFHFMMRAFGWE